MRAQVWLRPEGFKNACEVKDIGLSQQRIRKPNEVDAPAVAAHFAHEEPNSGQGLWVDSAERGPLPKDRSFTVQRLHGRVGLTNNSKDVTHCASMHARTSITTSAARLVLISGSISCTFLAP